MAFPGGKINGRPGAKAGLRGKMTGPHGRWAADGAQGVGQRNKAVEIARLLLELTFWPFGQMLWHRNL